MNIFQFTAKQPKLLLVGIVEACCRDAVVHQAPKIHRCFKAAPEAGSKADDPKYCMTEGVNLAGAWSFAHGIVDLNSIYTNDVAATLRTYGVEAARSVLIREIQGVFGVYGIGVDRRHLSLIADYMVSRPFPIKKALI
jgi:DNA-directed RNA polymerase I subunit RPA1